MKKHLITILVVSLFIFSASTKASFCNEIYWASIFWYSSFGGGRTKFIGTVTESFNSESIINSYWSYWSRFSTDSIHNEFWDFWGKYSLYSAFNQYASYPPKIFTLDWKWGYLSINNFLSPNLNTYNVLACANSYDNIFILSITEICQKTYWINSYGIWENCYCNEWYIWNDTKTSCIKKDPNEVCKMEYWPNAIEWDPGYCKCKEWYIWNKTQTSCEEMITYPTNTTYETKKSLELKAIVNIILDNKLATKLDLILIFDSCYKTNKNQEIKEACWILFDWLKV